MLVFKLVNTMSVPVEVHYRFLSSDVAIVYHMFGGRAYFCVVLVIAGVLFMPVNCLYCADFFV